MARRLTSRQPSSERIDIRPIHWPLSERLRRNVSLADGSRDDGNFPSIRRRAAPFFVMNCPTISCSRMVFV
jgi:hypothetical protein